MKIALVTGAGRGIGRAFVDYLASIDFIVYAGVRDLSGAKKLFDSDLVKPIYLDVKDEVSIQGAVSIIKEENGGLNILINNAGLNKDTATDGNLDKVCKLEKLDRKTLQRMFDVNSLGPLITTKHCVPIMNGDNSFIVNISSNRASFHDEFENTTANYGYRASKLALNMLTFALVKDLPSNISTFAVHPGDVCTDMNPDGSMKPVESAEAIIRIVQRWKPDFNGKFLRYDGTLYPL